MTGPVKRYLVASLAGVICLLTVGTVTVLRGRIQTAAGSLPGMTVAAKARRVYPYSVIAGGVQSASELRQALDADPVARQHYSGFDLKRTHAEVLREDRNVFVSYRVADHVFWTHQRVRLRKGETILTDGKQQARARCGNRIAEVAQGGLSNWEPPPETLDQWTETQRASPTALDEASGHEVAWLSGDRSDYLSKLGPVLVPGQAGVAASTNGGGQTGSRENGVTALVRRGSAPRALSETGGVAGPMLVDYDRFGQLLDRPTAMLAWNETAGGHATILARMFAVPSLARFSSDKVYQLDGGVVTEHTRAPLEPFMTDWDGTIHSSFKLQGDPAEDLSEQDFSVQDLSGQDLSAAKLAGTAEHHFTPEVTTPEPGTAVQGLLAAILLSSGYLIRRRYWTATPNSVLRTATRVEEV